MAELVSDEEEDELSKKAFTTLEDMENLAIDGLYPLIVSSVQSLKDLTTFSGIDISCLSNKQIVLSSQPIPLLSSANFRQLVMLKEKLGKYLSIFNGLIYMNEGKDIPINKIGVRMYTLMQKGISEFMQILTFLPLCLITQVLYIISNLTVDKRLGKMATLVIINLFILLD